MPLVQLWDLGFQPGVAKSSQGMDQFGKMQGERTGFFKKIGLGIRLEIVTKSLAQGVIPATEINVFLVVSVEENYVW